VEYCHNIANTRIVHFLLPSSGIKHLCLEKIEPDPDQSQNLTECSLADPEYFVFHEPTAF